MSISNERLESIKKVSLINFMKDQHPERIIIRKDGTLSLRSKEIKMVFYDEKQPHSYTFGSVVSHPYKDNIGTLRELFGYSFEEACTTLEDWAATQDGYSIFD